MMNGEGGFMTEVYDSLSREGKILLDETMQRLDGFYDDGFHLLGSDKHEQRRHNVRASAHYALGLLVRGGGGDIRRADQIINAVIDTQFDCPGEIYHGTFRRTPDEPHPPSGKLPWRDITLHDRYFMDVAYERIVNDFRKRMDADEELQPFCGRIEALLNKAVLHEYPVVWKSYDPNWREFILCAFVLILEYFEKVLDHKTVCRMDDAAKKAVEGAIARSRSMFSPLNTNIEIMHVFVLDYFGNRFKNAYASSYALNYAEQFWKKYSEYHAVNEFNSPTYCGVDLTAVGFLRKFASQPRIRELGEKLETGLWEDISEFYNPAMLNMCGPFSRNYEMDMSRHTAMHALMFLGLGMDRFAGRPFNTESDHNTLLVLSGVHIPDHVQARLLETGVERTVKRQFHELSERGDPRDNAALCTATAWITDSLMTGAMSGSKNVSGQLHPATVYWRDTFGTVSSMRLLRGGAKGETDGFHTVVFDCAANRNHISVDVSCQVNRDIQVFFEFESPGAGQAVIMKDSWELAGLKVKVDAKAPDFFVERMDGRLRVCYLAKDDVPESKHMHFELHFILEGCALADV
jgi:hypothetical protein